ncbi:DnaT-like ssDNA-binding domain-containing protein [Neptuniibacter halophilus]|uniref:DnaT-like ssDNA-binding domain-containing protein n=1 Tax=Neptuniibacter halophilus TaxID=651666 RepID=UPI0025722694|nr:DnaT-like ssDNA-binding domain-containing protein [Neptuniibacter halophilus]
MSYTFPETPVLLYPSMARELGVEAAVLLSLYHQQAERLPGFPAEEPELIFSHAQWLTLGQFWEEEQLAQLTNVLVEAGIIEAAFMHDGRVQIRFVADGAVTEAEPETELEMVSRLPVVEAVPSAPPPPPPVAEPATYTQEAYPELQDTPYYPDTAPVQPAQSAPRPGPAPTFGGSIGWARRTRQGDELQALFRQHEQRNKQMHPMELGWQPSENFYALLPRHNISPQFAQTCLDEFVLYWLDKDRKETNWDQKFLGWVKREWVKKQTQEGRQQRLSQEQQAGFSHENPRRDTREKRQRVTAAIMDIKDTDW